MALDPAADLRIPADGNDGKLLCLHCTDLEEQIHSQSGGIKCRPEICRSRRKADVEFAHIRPYFAYFPAFAVNNSIHQEEHEVTPKKAIFLPSAITRSQLPRLVLTTRERAVAVSMRDFLFQMASLGKDRHDET